MVLDTGEYPEFDNTGYKPVKLESDAHILQCKTIYKATCGALMPGLSNLNCMEQAWQLKACLSTHVHCLLRSAAQTLPQTSSECIYADLRTLSTKNMLQAA